MLIGQTIKQSEPSSSQNTGKPQQSIINGEWGTEYIHLGWSTQLKPQHQEVLRKLITVR